jgi:two-component system cell cycle response regulator
VRDGDLLCRYGGEEFALLLSDPGAESAALVAERLRLEVAGLCFSLSRQGGAENSGTAVETETVQVTISLGLTIASARNLREDGVVTLLDRADQALYAAKRGGRNCTMIDQQVISEFRAPQASRARKDDAADKKSAAVDRSYGSLFPAAQVANDG